MGKDLGWGNEVEEMLNVTSSSHHHKPAPSSRTAQSLFSGCRAAAHVTSFSQSGSSVFENYTWDKTVFQLVGAGVPRPVMLYQRITAHPSNLWIEFTTHPLNVRAGPKSMFFVHLDRHPHGGVSGRGRWSR